MIISGKNSVYEALNSNRFLIPGIKTTQSVSKIENTNAPQRNLFCFLTVKMEWLSERALKEWKLSVKESVKKAIVIPSALFVISQHFASK